MKNLIFILSKWLGVFKISRYLTRRGLRILCYHGFTDGKESCWKPGTFINISTFEKRLQYLKKAKFPVLNLEDALNRLKDGTLPKNATVITIDDGWYSTKKYAHEVLTKYNYPYTIYVTSYYSKKETPIFEMALKYMFWNTKIDIISLDGVGIKLKSTNNDSTPVKVSEHLMNSILRVGQECESNKERVEMLKYYGKKLNVDYLKIETDRNLSLLKKSEIKQLSNWGVDIQLHTHRHILGTNRNAIENEINQNRAYLEEVTKNKLEHFCYPNGQCTNSQLQILRDIGIKSATTCDFGLNNSNTEVLKLRRYVDRETKDSIDFEAEMSGFKDLLYNLIVKQ